MIFKGMFFVMPNKKVQFMC